MNTSEHSTHTTAHAEGAPLRRIKGFRQTYAPAQKVAALARIEQGQTIAATARELGIVEQTLGTWVKDARQKGQLAQAAATTQQSREVERLAAEVADLTTRLARSERERNALRLSVTALTGALA